MLHLHNLSLLANHFSTCARQYLDDEKAEILWKLKRMQIYRYSSKIIKAYLLVTFLTYAIQ